MRANDKLRFFGYSTRRVVLLWLITLAVLLPRSGLSGEAAKNATPAQSDSEVDEAQDTVVDDEVLDLMFKALKTKDYNEAKRTLRRAVSLERRPGGNPEILAMALTHLGMRALFAHELDEAGVYLTEAVAIFERNKGKATGNAGEGPADAMASAFSLNQTTATEMLAEVLQQQDRLEEALKVHQRALLLAQQSLPAGSAFLAAIPNNMGSIYEQIGDYNSAKQLYGRALSELGKTKEPDLDMESSVLSNLARVARQTNDYQRSEEFYLRAVAIYDRSHPQSLQLARTVNDLGLLYAEEGKYRDAEVEYERAAEIFVRNGRQNETEFTAVLDNLSKVLQATGRIGELKEIRARLLTSQAGH